MKHFYIKEGNDYKEILYAVGMYYNSDGSFTDTFNENSIGICVEQDYEKRVICIMKNAQRFGYKEAIDYTIRHKKENYYIPTYEQLRKLAHIKNISQITYNLIKRRTALVWTNEINNYSIYKNIKSVLHDTINDEDVNTSEYIIDNEHIDNAFSRWDAKILCLILDFRYTKEITYNMTKLFRDDKAILFPFFNLYI